MLVSLDGFRWDYLDRGLTPNLSRLAREGVRAEAMVPVFPTKTFPNHYTIVTGRYPARHGILGNVFTAVPPFRNIHVYPLLAAVLGLDPGTTDGSLDSVRAMLRNPS